MVRQKAHQPAQAPDENLLGLFSVLTAHSLPLGLKFTSHLIFLLKPDRLEENLSG